MKNLYFKRHSAYYIMHTAKGFTLIELLVVMSIIALLSVISLFALKGTRESARDTLRKSNLQQIASAIEIFKSDCKYYPPSLTAGSSLTGVSPCNPINSNVYMQIIPDDVDVSKNYRYIPTPAGCTTTCTGYRLWALLENSETMPAYCTIVTAPVCKTGVACNYCIINP